VISVGISCLLPFTSTSLWIITKNYFAIIASCKLAQNFLLFYSKISAFYPFKVDDLAFIVDKLIGRFCIGQKGLIDW